MREYGQIQCSFWQSDAVEGTTDVGKLLAAYLMTGPHSNGIGCYHCPDGYVMADLGWPSETVSKGFEELSRNGFAYRFGTVVLIPNFLRWNRISNANVAVARMTEFRALPKGEAKRRAAGEFLKYGKHLTDDDCAYLETVAQTVSETVTQTLSKQNPIPSHPNPSDQNTFVAEDDDGCATLDAHDREEPAPPPESAESPKRPTKALHEQIIAAYHEVLPELPAVRDWPERRRRKLDARIAERLKAGKQADKPEYWRSLFASVQASDFLCGRKSDWRCPGLEWLLEPKNFTKVIEGSYRNNDGMNGHAR